MPGQVSMDRMSRQTKRTASKSPVSGTNAGVLITACILARNEENRIGEALKSLQGWTDELIVIDNESTDTTVAVARRYDALVLSAPRCSNFDAARNLAIECAKGEWIFYLDADERVPEELGHDLRSRVLSSGHEFEAMCIPFKHFFCGKWMQYCNWWPGYTRPQLLKRGAFHYNDRLHTGVEVTGRTVYYPPDDHSLAIVHYSYDDLHHYISKLNAYTTGEAESLLADGQAYTWQSMLAHFVHDWQVYYDKGQGASDGMHGFVLSFLSGIYRFVSRAKLWRLARDQNPSLPECSVPVNVREMLEFMARVAQEGAGSWLRSFEQQLDPTLLKIPTEWITKRQIGTVSEGKPANSKLDHGEYSNSEHTTPLAKRGQSKLTKNPSSRHRLITGCILARNEETQLADALRSLAPYVDELLVIDHASSDETPTVAHQCGARVVTVSELGQSAAFDELRNHAKENAQCEWVLFLDADERLQPTLGEALRNLVLCHGSEFDAVCLPFQNIFYDKWMRSKPWWPGYKGPQLIRRGSFDFAGKLHVGALVRGKTMYFPTVDPECSIKHFAYPSLERYIDKLNAYTGGEAEYLYEAGASHSWQSSLAHFVHDWGVHYDDLSAHEDGMHGFVQSFLCSLYRFVSRAKLWDMRRKKDEAPDTDASDENRLPADLREMLQFMAHVEHHGAERWLNSKHETPVANNRHASRTSNLPLLWVGPLLDASGYAEDGRNLVLGLADNQECVSVIPQCWGKPVELPEHEADWLRMHANSVEANSDIVVVNTLPRILHPFPNGQFQIARTVFETDRLNPGWVDRLNLFDRVWVPSEFNRDTFTASGVESSKIAVVPEAFDSEKFASTIRPWPLPGDETYKFLSVFDWSLHKGWDVLLEAFAHEYASEPGVGLVIKTWSSNHYSMEMIREQADQFLTSRLGKSLSDFPNIHLWEEQIPVQDMPRVYKGANCFVISSRCEGWCRPLMEAMASGIPTIATGWGGMSTYHNENSGYPITFSLQSVSEAGAREIPIYSGHRWAEPDLRSLRRWLRHVKKYPDAAKKRAKRGQSHVIERYSRDVIGKSLKEELAYCRSLLHKKRVEGKVPVQQISAREHDRIAEKMTGINSPGSIQRKVLPVRAPAHPLPLDEVKPVDFREVLGRPLRVRFEGDQTLLSSLARVNRELCFGFLDHGDIELSLYEARNPWPSLVDTGDSRFQGLTERLNAPLSGPPDVTIRHHFPPNWSSPPEGKLIVIQPWELSHLPEASWVEGATRNADEVWAYSRFVRDIYVRSGVPAERVSVLSLGVNPNIYNPNGIQISLPTRSSLRFLFVGGALERKGADLLLEAYVRAFDVSHDVCLVVKDMGTTTFYQGQTLRDTILRAQANPQCPEIIYIDQDLSEEALASLYRACSCVVLPYRGEGFGLSPLEGMACGKPAIVTAGGSTDDYLDDGFALRVPSRRVSFQKQSSGPQAQALPWQLEPDIDALTDAFRWVHDHPDEMIERGALAGAHVRSGWSWDRTVLLARQRMMSLIDASAAPLAIDSIGSPIPWKPATSSNEDSAPRKGKARRSKPELSLCMIARNEEARIGECLSSIAPYVDEMIVVDTGSADRTPEIAEASGARVFSTTWKDSFSIARNQSLEQARGNWLFWMDADDVISPKCGERLRELVRESGGRQAAYQVQVRIPPGPNEHSESVVDHVKLFPNRSDLRFEFRIHEQILTSLRRASIDIQFTDIYVTHQHYDRSPEGQSRKRVRDFRLLELDLREHPDHPFVLFNLGMTHLYATKEFEVAAHYLQRCLNRSDWRDSIVRKAFALLTTARSCQYDWAAAIDANETGRRYYPDDAELLFQAGQIYQQTGRFDEARLALERLLSGRESGYYRSVDDGLRSYRGLHEIGLLYDRMGDTAHYIEVLEDIVIKWPEYTPALAELSRVREM